jgi:hypothetical protein
MALCQSYEVGCWLSIVSRRAVVGCDFKIGKSRSVVAGPRIAPEICCNAWNPTNCLRSGRIYGDAILGFATSRAEGEL